MLNDKSVDNKFTSSHDLLDPELTGRYLLGVDRKTHTIVLEKPQNSDAKSYYGAKKIDT